MTISEMLRKNREFA